MVVKSDVGKVRKTVIEPDPPGQADQVEVCGQVHQGIVELFKSLRERLIIFFEVRHCVDPEELADATLERVMEKLCNGTKVEDLGRYSFGVAKNVLFEYLRGRKKMLTFIDEQRYKPEPAASSAAEDQDMQERSLTCLEECMAHLKEQDRLMLLDYYRFKGRAKLDQRRQIAEQLSISRETLALRVFHLKQKLKKCVKERLEGI